jgi:hypothetical protein
LTNVRVIGSKSSWCRGNLPDEIVEILSVFEVPLMLGGSVEGGVILDVELPIDSDSEKEDAAVDALVDTLADETLSGGGCCPYDIGGGPYPPP